MNKYFIADFIAPLVNWRMIYLRAIQSIRNRFARSKLGQIWTTLSLSVLLTVIGAMWSLIFGFTLDEFLPTLVTGYVIYLLLATTITESCKAIIDDEKFYQDRPYSFFLSIYVLVARNIVFFLYNVLIILLAVAWSDSAAVSLPLLYPVYILLSMALLFFGSFTISMLCVYFRDIIPLVGTIMSVAFLMTPVLWKPTMIPEIYRDYIYFNPFACMLELLRNPLVGQPISDMAVLATLGWGGLALITSWVVWKRYSRHAIYWI